jgi:DNA-binding NarL/FixJ family response regulator
MLSYALTTTLGCRVVAVIPQLDFLSQDCVHTELRLIAAGSVTQNVIRVRIEPQVQQLSQSTSRRTSASPSTEIVKLSKRRLNVVVTLGAGDKCV